MAQRTEIFYSCDWCGDQISSHEQVCQITVRIVLNYTRDEEEAELCFKCKDELMRFVKNKGAL